MLYARKTAYAFITLLIMNTMTHCSFFPRDPSIIIVPSASTVQATAVQGWLLALLFSTFYADFKAGTPPFILNFFSISILMSEAIPCGTVTFGPNMNINIFG
jgi:hypothetical protein